LLRRYFTEGSDLNKHGSENLKQEAVLFSGRLRKSSGWMISAGRLQDLIFEY